MNQPQLGLKVSELRQQKGLTQEQLAERCEVSPRTIQRIESGEVDPRAYTLHCLGEALEFDFGEENTGNENLWLAILHLSSIFCILIVPLLLWSWKKNQSYKIDQHGRQVLNFQITMTLSLFAALFFMLVGLPALILLSMDMGEDLSYWLQLWPYSASFPSSSSASSAPTRAWSMPCGRWRISPFAMRSASHS